MVSFTPTQWNHFLNIADTPRLGDNDRACLDAVRDVLARFGCLNRFGVNLLHKHFEMEADEILVEFPNEVTRELVTRPVKIDLLRDDLAAAYETQWHWRADESGGLTQICNNRCFPGTYDSPQHINRHVGY
jgi:hypothetical protein